ERIASAARAAGRDPAQVRLIVVTKTYPAADVLRLAALQVLDVGENRDQEAAPKAAEVAAAGVEVCWHFVGRLQRNKCRSVVRYAGMVQSVDSVRLATALARARGDLPAEGERVPLDTLVQVSLDGDAARGGAVAGGGDPDTALERVLAAVASAGQLRLRGLMAVAPLGWEPERAFADLARIAAPARTQYPDATVLAAGMSGDREEAIRHGATHVRVGTAVLGARPAPR